ncbi:MAG: hypothetical protein JSU57_03070 [Candidatus Heimdallarchaeota archaeon]|nr:MAG: hypothetical protein JSU57_03070 [Candidatus Heimdallarchaeota archaeon]
MTSDLPPGVLIQSRETKERCGKCNEPFTMETYLEPLSEQRSYLILCQTCNYTIPLADDQ